MSDFFTLGGTACLPSHSYVMGDDGWRPAPCALILEPFTFYPIPYTLYLIPFSFQIINIGFG